MTADERTRVRHGSVLTAVVPDGWRSSERRSFTAPSGTEIQVDVVAAPAGRGPTALLDERVTWARGRLPDVADVVGDDAVGDGREHAAGVRFSFRHDGDPWVARLVCWYEGALAVVVSAAGPAVVAGGDSPDGLARIDAEIVELIDGLQPIEPPTEHPLHRAQREVPTSPTDPARWGALASVWSSATPEIAERAQVTRWSPEEIEVCAALLGVDATGIIGAGVLAGASDETRRAVTRAVLHSLVVRGALESGDDGNLRPAGDPGVLVEVALASELAINVERIGAGRAGWWSFGVGPDRACLVTRLVDAVFEVAAVDPAAVLGHALALGALAPSSAGGDAAPPLPDATPISVDVDAVAAGEAPVVDLVRCSLSWRDQRTVHGEVQTWGIDRQGTVWLAEEAASGPPSWTMRPADPAAVRDALLSGLPTAGIRGG